MNTFRAQFPGLNYVYLWVGTSNVTHQFTQSLCEQSEELLVLVFKYEFYSITEYPDPHSLFMIRQVAKRYIIVARLVTHVYKATIG